MKLSKRFSILIVVAAALLMGAVTQQAEEKPEGAEIFRAKCSMCHGVDGKGFSALKTPDFTSSKWQDSVKDSEILNAIKNGKKDTAMPAFSDKLNEKEILAVLRQIRAFGRKK
jgi:cytochrome c oxidase cbb3-type subunit III